MASDRRYEYFGVVPWTASRLKELREKRGFTQADVAEKMQTARVGVTLIEGGKRDISLSTMCRYLAAINVDIFTVFENVPPVADFKMSAAKQGQLSKELTQVGLRKTATKKKAAKKKKK